MKRIIVVLLAALVSLLSVGCSQSLVGPTAVESSGEAVANAAIVLAPIGALQKMAAGSGIDIPTRVLIQKTEGAGGDFTVLPIDTIQIGAGLDTVFASLKGLKKGQLYTASVWTENNLTNRQLNNSGYIQFTVPNADTFPLVINMKAAGEKISMTAPIKGSPVAATAKSFCLTWTTDYWGQSWSDLARVDFTPGSLDTVKLEAIMPIPVPLNSGYIGYLVSARIECSDGSHWQGSGSVNISPSANATLTIQLTEYNGTGSLAKMTIVLKQIGNLWVVVSFS